LFRGLSRSGLAGLLLHEVVVLVVASSLTTGGNLSLFSLVKFLLNGFCLLEFGLFVLAFVFFFVEVEGHTAVSYIHISSYFVLWLWLLLSVGILGIFYACFS